MLAKVAVLVGAILLGAVVPVGAEVRLQSPQVEYRTTPLGIDVTQLAIEDAKLLRPGQRVTVSCQQMGSGGDELWVQDCAIQVTGDVALPSAEIAPSSQEQAE